MALPPKTLDRHSARAVSDDELMDKREHWMALERADGSPYASRFAGIGASIPERRLPTDELMASTRYQTDIDLERLTGVRERAAHSTAATLARKARVVRLQFIESLL